MNETRRCNVILSIDPFEKRLEATRHSIKELHYWAKKVGSRIEAVHVLSESDQNPRFNQLYTRAYDLLDQHVRKLSLGVPVQIKVIWDHHDLIQHPAHTLVDYAEESGADLILVSSHGRKWLSRMIMGSFAEKLLMSSRVPVLFFGRAAQSGDTVRRVLFATDFSEASKLAYKRFLTQIRPINPEVIVFHVAEYPNFVTGMSLTGVGAYLPEAYWKVMKESLISEGETWVKIAAQQGILSRSIIEEGIGDVAHSIQRVAESEHVSMIGLASVRHEFQKLVMGSVSNQVFRAGTRSVWVCGPKAFEALLSTKQDSTEKKTLTPGTRTPGP